MTCVTDIGSKARAHLSFACAQAKLGISLDRWGIEVVFVKQTITLVIFLPQVGLNFGSFSPSCSETGISVVIAYGLDVVYFG